MAKMTCKCGEYLSITACPNDVQLRVFTDEEYDRLVDCVYDGKPENMPTPKYDVWRCRKCKRIYVFEDGNDRAVMVYSLEKDSSDNGI